MQDKALTLWHRLIEPAPSVTDANVRRQSRFFASFMLLTLIFVPSGMIFFALNDSPVMTYSMLLIGAVTFISYLLNRRGQYELAGVFVVTLLTVVVYVRAFTFSTPESPRQLYSLSFIILFSGIFLPRRITLGLGVAHLGLMLVFPQLADGVDTATMVDGPLFYHFTMIIFTLMVSWFIERRHALDTDQINESRQRYKLLAAENAMQAQWLQDILSATPDHFVVFDRDGRIQYVNGAVTHDLGFQREQMIGKTWEELGMQGPVSNLFKRYLRQMFDGEGTASADVRDIHTDQHYTLTFRPIHAPDGQVVSAVATRRDITPYVKAQRELAASNERYRIISELISDYAFSFALDEDGEMQLEWITDSFTKVTGYDWDELVATGDIFTLYHPDDREAAIAHVEAAMQGESTESEVRIITYGGEERWVHMRRRPEFDLQTGHVSRYYGVVQDVTARRLAERQRARLEAERAQLDIVQEFVRAVSHDFRNSLANIETSRYLLHRHLVEPSGEERLLRKSANIHGYVRHLSEQLDNLNTIFSLTRKQRAPLDLNDMLNTIVQQITPAAKARSIELVADHLSDLPTISGSVQELTQAVRHLLNNAMAYTPPHGSVTLSAQVDDEVVVIRVADTGPGIGAEHLPHIFDLFYRADPARSMDAGGVGIGLSIVKLIMEAHNGSVDVYSPDEEGATFILTLPIIDESASAG